MNISIYGLGYVGCVTAACLASQGHRVIGVDVNADKVKAINDGYSLIVEHGLDALISAGRKSGNLRATENSHEASVQGDILIVCVGTPSDANGNLNFTYIDRVCTDIAHALRESSGFKVVAVRSTLLPGVINQRVIPLLIKQSGKQIGVDFAVAINPEFLREGSALSDFNNPPFTVVGTDDDRAAVMLEQLYENIPAPFYRTKPDTACMVKYACNAFHGLKVVFANEIGQLCKESGVDGTQVMEIFCQDTNLNISPKYLRPGFSFGGSCLPKDLRALLYLARHADLQVPMLESILPSNRLHTQKAADMILKNPKRTKIGIIGLTFKPGTDDLRESPIVQLVETLIGKGLKVKIYDNNIALSKIIGGNKVYIEQVLPHISMMMSDSMDEVIQSSDVVVVSHDLKDKEERLLKLLKPEQLVIDLVKIANNESFPAAYEGICW